MRVVCATVVAMVLVGAELASQKSLQPGDKGSLITFAEAGFAGLAKGSNCGPHFDFSEERPAKEYGGFVTFLVKDGIRPVTKKVEQIDVFAVLGQKVPEFEVYPSGMEITMSPADFEKAKCLKGRLVPDRRVWRL